MTPLHTHTDIHTIELMFVRRELGNRVGRISRNPTQHVHVLLNHPRTYVCKAGENQYERISNQRWIKDRTSDGRQCTATVYYGTTAAPPPIQNQFRRSQQRPNRPMRRYQPYVQRQLPAPVPVRALPSIGNYISVAAMAESLAARISSAITDATRIVRPLAPIGGLQHETVTEKVNPTGLNGTPTCVICMDSDKKCNIVCQPCMHMCACESCSEHVTGRCPICRAAITAKQVVFY